MGARARTHPAPLARTALAALAALIAAAFAACGSETENAAKNVGATVSTTTAPTGTTLSEPPAGSTFELSTTDLRVGQPVTFSGSGCPPAYWVGIYAPEVTSSGGTTPEEVHPDADGRWSITVPVSDSTALGPQTAHAACKTPDRARIAFRYPPVPINVTTYRRLEVSPATTVAAGTTLDVSAVGACPEFYDASVTFNGTSDATKPFSALGTVAENDNGEWTARVDIAADAAPGVYKIDALCIRSRAFGAFYTPVTVTVAAQGTQPSESPGTLARTQ